MKTSTNRVMVPYPRVEAWVPVNWVEIQYRLKKSQKQIDRARRRADRIEKAIFQSFISAIYLWHQQGGICPWCGKAITPLTGWSRHHIIPRSQGGSYALVNLQLLHPNCHVELERDLMPKQDVSSLNQGSVKLRAVA